MTSSKRTVYEVCGAIDCEDVKRCYVGGAVVEVPCPKCGEPFKWDLESDYISHPVHNVWCSGYDFDCKKCNHSWEVEVKFQAVAKVEVRNCK